VGTGPLLGLIPDPTTFAFIFTPAFPGFIVHFIVVPGLYPDAGAAMFPAGTFSSLAGLNMDTVMCYFNLAGEMIHVTNVKRITF
jgi:hypothetical protein